MTCEVKCPDCPFGGTRVSTKGSPDAPLVIVGESPGSQEVREGEPFVGPSGKVLESVIPFNADMQFITNALFCNPPKQLKKDASRVDRAIAACRGRLLASITDRRVKPKIILALGNYAVWSLTGDHSLRITKCRGKLIPSPLAEYGILPAIHPAALMRGTGSYRQFKEDLSYAHHLANGGSPKQYTHTKWKSVNTMADCYYALRELQQYPELTADIETTGFNPARDRILSIGIKGGGQSGDVTETRAYCFRATLKLRLWSILTDPNIEWCWHNGKFDISFLREVGIEARVDDDTMLMSYTLDENPGVHDLEQVANEVLGAPDYKDMLTQHVGTGKNKKDYSAVPEPVLDEYLAYDVDNTHQIRKIYRERIAADPIAEKLYTETLLPASELLYHIERRGMLLDLERVEENDEYYKKEIARVRGDPTSSW